MCLTSPAAGLEICSGRWEGSPSLHQQLPPANQETMILLSQLTRYGKDLSPGAIKSPGNSGCFMDKLILPASTSTDSTRTSIWQKPCVATRASAGHGSKHPATNQRSLAWFSHVLTNHPKLIDDYLDIFSLHHFISHDFCSHTRSQPIAFGSQGMASWD